jgi:hypothetical protein
VTSVGEGEGRILEELRVLRLEMAQLREEQKALARDVAQMAQTFRSLATQLGIAAEPYRRGTKETRQNDVPGFG